MAFDDPPDSPDPGRRASLRASDAEREQAAEALRGHHGDGRLTDDELEQRLHAAYRARTAGELRGLFADLPGPERRPSTWPERWAGPRGGRPPLVLLALGAIALVSLLGWLAGGPGGPGGPGGYHHHPPLIVALLVAFVAWRLVVRRRRRRRSGATA